MGKVSGDPIEQHTLDIVQRVAASPELLKRYLRNIGAAEPERTAKLLTASGSTIVPVHECARPKFTKPPKNTAKQIDIEQTRVVPTTENAFAAEGALLTWKDFKALPFKVAAWSRGDQLWRPSWALSFSVVRQVSAKLLFRGVVLLGFALCDGRLNPLKNPLAPPPSVEATGSIVPSPPTPDKNVAKKQPSRRKTQPPTQQRNFYQKIDEKLKQWFAQ
jgi:hypothetical protein